MFKTSKWKKERLDQRQHLDLRQPLDLRQSRAVCIRYAHACFRVGQRLYVTPIAQSNKQKHNTC